MADDDTITIGGPLRLALGLLLFLAAAALGVLGFRLGWGIGWMAWIPALFLILPAGALGGRQVVRRVPGGLELTTGRIFRRILALRMDAAEVEIVPTGGAWAVILHRHGSAQVLASWVGRATADRIAALCDRAHPEGIIPRLVPRMPAGDR